MNNKDTNMLDKNGNKLLKASPLKIFGSIVNIVRGNKATREAKARREKANEANRIAAAGIKDAIGDYQDIDLSNPFKDMTKEERADSWSQVLQSYLGKN